MSDSRAVPASRAGRRPKDFRYVGVKLARDVYDALRAHCDASGRTMTWVVESALREHLGLVEAVPRTRVVVLPQTGTTASLSASDVELLREILRSYDSQVKE